MHPSGSLIDTSNEKSVYWLSFALRCLLGLLAWWASWYTDFALVGDAVTYETMEGGSRSSGWPTAHPRPCRA